MFDQIQDEIVEREMLKILRSIQNNAGFGLQSSSSQNKIKYGKEMINRNGIFFYQKDIKNNENAGSDDNLIGLKDYYTNVMKEYQSFLIGQCEKDDTCLQRDENEDKSDSQANIQYVKKCDGMNNRQITKSQKTQQNQSEIEEDEEYLRQKQMIENLYEDEEDVQISKQQKNKLHSQNNKLNMFQKVKENKSIDLTSYATNDSESSTQIAPSIQINEIQHTDKIIQKQDLKQNKSQEGINHPRNLLPENHFTLTREMYDDMIKKETEQLKVQEKNINKKEEYQINNEDDIDNQDYQRKDQNEKVERIQKQKCEQNDTLFEVKREYLRTNKWESNEYKITYSNNDVYEGEVDEKDSLKDGWGNYFYSNGEKYEGFFQDDVINGYGRYWFLGGHKYEGDWKNGVKYGIGQLDFASGDKYIGFFEKDNFHGSGEYFYKSGDKFEGKFINGKKNGPGKFLGCNGIKIIGEWINDQLKQQ